MKYTESQIKEFAKMGYYIDNNGNLTKEVRIQKIIRVSEATQTIKNIELSSLNVSETKTFERSFSTSFTKINSRVKEEWLDPERLIRGLVTLKQKGVDYSLLPDGTKVCRCCQNRYKGTDFYTSQKSKDGLRIICKSCHNKQSKTYLEDIKK